MTRRKLPEPPSDVAQAYAGFPAKARKHLAALRKLVLNSAAANPAIGPLDETLKWGEPAYLPTRARTGSTLRLGWKAARPDHCALYFNCNTTLVDSFRTLFPDLEFEGNRALWLPLDQPLPEEALGVCIDMTFTYHLNKRGRTARSTP